MILCDMIDGPENMSKFQRIYEKYKNMMYSVAYDISKNPHDAEDIVEVSLIKVIEILNKIELDDIGKPRCKNLMITITKNTAIDYGRKAENKILPYERIENYQMEKTTEDVYIDLENYKEVISYIRELEDKYRDVLHLKIFYKMTSKEIGKLLGITEQNVNMRYMRAKSMLKQRLEERRKNG